MAPDPRIIAMWEDTLPSDPIGDMKKLLDDQHKCRSTHSGRFVPNSYGDPEWECQEPEKHQGLR